VAIPEEDVARVRAATDVVALISEHAALKRQGRRWVGLCPFHQEKSPSFSVNAEEGLYYCFGCQRSGDAISFVRDVEHVDFVEAVRRLADRAGVTITEDAAAAADRQRRGPLFDAMAKAVAFYHERLLSAPDAGRARDYLRSRGYDGEVVRTFQLGWAPDGWDELAAHLKSSEKVLVESGLGFVNRRGRRQDAFRGRVIFPIFDPSGRAIALGGRILPPGAGAGAGAGAGSGSGSGAGSAAVTEGPKYKNSQDGPIYSKKRTLYGLNWAKTDVVASGEVIVCEGYTDVIAFFRAGMPRAVATCGTALGEEHFKLLRNFAKRVVLAYDADAAGEAGARRVYEWERHHEIDVAVVALPAGTDPADLARTDPGALRDAVSGAQPFLRFRVEQVLQSVDLRSAEGRAKAAEAALAVVAEHPNGLVRDQYLMMVADRCRLEATALRGLLAELVKRIDRGEPRASTGGEARTRPRRPGPAEETGGPRSDGAGPQGEASGTGRRRAPGHDGEVQRAGLEALRLAVHDPESVTGRLEPLLFSDGRQRAAWVALCDGPDLHEAIRRVEQDEPDVAALLRRLAVEEPAAGADDVVVQLVWSATRRALADLESEARLSPDASTRLSGVVTRVSLDVQELDRNHPDFDESRAIEAAERLLAWLVGRGEENA
jgi:DNA primase